MTEIMTGFRNHTLGHFGVTAQWQRARLKLRYDRSGRSARFARPPLASLRLRREQWCPWTGFFNSELILIWTKTSFRLKWSDTNLNWSPVQFSISSVSVSFQYQFIIAFFTDLFEKFFHFTTFIYCNIQICDKDTSINNFEFMRIFSFIIGKNSQWIDDTLFKTMCYLEIYWSLNFEKLVWRIGNIQVNH